MPATDKTRYEMRRLHIVFAVTSVVLLVATVWMVAVDHARPWKQFQLRERALQQWTLGARIRAAEFTLAGAAPAERDAASNELKRLRTLFDKHSGGWGEWLLRQPILDAFDTRRSLQINQIWLPDLPIHNDFRDLARFDRCVTCHQSIDQTLPGSAVAPAQVGRRTLTVTLPTPDAALQPSAGDDADAAQRPTLLQVYGMELAAMGQWCPEDVTIAFVVPRSRGARAGLEMGDVIRQVDGEPVGTRGDVVDRLLGDEVAWGSRLRLEIQRGLPQPFVAHPRLDLFVGALSPHKKDVMGCTICHAGQGSATSFDWASHTPNNPTQALDWYHRYGWFDNRHWIDPMRPARFVESGCLKCHPDVVELEPSDRFPDPPAPKLLRGFHLVEQLGCFGCHEINGYDDPSRRVGPDLRSEPNVFAVAETLLAGGKLTDAQRTWAETLVLHPQDHAARNQLRDALRAESSAPGAERAAALAELLRDVDRPGTMRRVGPSLRRLSAKVDVDFVQDWIHKPSDFRPTTRMPQPFGQWEHLEGKSLAVAKAYEPLEIRALAQYLLKISQPFAYAAPPPGITETPSVERGKKLLQTRGCLACHRHAALPGIESDHGPDLSRVGAKLATAKGRKWLSSWLTDPHRYDVRTKMPKVPLEPIALTDAEGKSTGKVTDPVADLVAFLSASDDWQPTPWAPLSATDQQTLRDLALEHLAETFPKAEAEGYLETGIPQAEAEGLPGGERILVGAMRDSQDRTARLLDYVAWRSIYRYGCFGCHDIPGFEAAKPIGPALTDWGRKEGTQLAFESIDQFLAGHLPGTEALPAKVAPAGRPADVGQVRGFSLRENARVRGANGHVQRKPTPRVLHRVSDTDFYVQALRTRRREGFIWQKLRAPRSYDYGTAADRGYNERLRMPRFQLDNAQREAIITFVLGLVIEPVPPRYQYRPDPRQAAIVAGRKVLEKYQCATCHFLKMARWEFDYQPATATELGTFEPPPPARPDFPFLKITVVPEEQAASLHIDRRGLRHGVVHGLPELSDATGQPLLVDEDAMAVDADDLLTGEDAAGDAAGDAEDEEAFPTFYNFILWKPALIDGQLRLVGGPKLMLPPAGIKKYPAWGGALARYLFPIVIADEKAVSPQIKGSEAWGWLPPALVNEGERARPDWLHDFLLDPYPVRPAMVMQMPRFNLSAAEASSLADYFAAVSEMPYPVELERRRHAISPRAGPTGDSNPYAAAMRIVLDNNYCVKCHSVGDFTPQRQWSARAPNLADVYRRLRPRFVRRWIANPARYLPYSPMPVNIPYEPTPPNFGGIDQSLCPGTSIEQLDALVDLLSNFDHYAIEHQSVRQQLDATAK
jgi:cytochrome c551/c552